MNKREKLYLKSDTYVKYTEINWRDTKVKEYTY